MKCPKCQFDDTKVVESRDIADNSAMRRRRECLKCCQRFTTYERLEVPYLLVKKKDGRQELFDRMKILVGLKKACEKRPITDVQIEATAANIERAIFERGETSVKASEIGKLIMDCLRKLDEVAYVRFASVYRSFADVTAFEKELAKLRRQDRATI